MNKQEEKKQTDFDKRACEAWSEWLTEMHEREERRQTAARAESFGYSQQ